MKVCRLSILNFRGVRSGTVYFPKHAVLIGDNNIGKTTLLEALDLVLGPDRLNRVPPIDEHDFYEGKYLPVAAPAALAAAQAAGAPVAPPSKPAPAQNPAAVQMAVPAAVPAVAPAPFPPAAPVAIPTAAAEALPAAAPADTAAVAPGADVEQDTPAPQIEVEVVIGDLSEEQIARFGDYIEFWDVKTNVFYDVPKPEGVDAEGIIEVLRVTFQGRYDPEEDDFEGKTYYTRSLHEGPTPVAFTRKDKHACGFLFLRTQRTGTRALSLERGSLLDIVLRLKEVRPQMWEDTISSLSGHSVAAAPELGLSGVLESISAALKKYVPKEWGVGPHLKVSNLTREHLRKTITAFIATGEGKHAAPYFRQGTGTINMLVLAMLSQIAADKQNVIFAMEEPETAIPPYAQKRIVHEIRKLASQTIFTSHSPYVLEEFSLDETVVLRRDEGGVLSQSAIELPPSVKLKRYRQEFRTRFCEGLLARRVLIAEGATEAAAFPVACRRLHELNPEKYLPLEALGISVIDAGSDSAIANMAKLYAGLGKVVFGLCDKQTDAAKAIIEKEVSMLFMHSEVGFENLVLKHTTAAALERHAKEVEWPQHLKAKYPNPEQNAAAALSEYFEANKANWAVADFLAQCAEDEIPTWLRTACETLTMVCSLPVPDKQLFAKPAPVPPAPPASNQ